MANLSSEIVIHDISYRPCTVKGRRALFHKWIVNEDILVKCRGPYSSDIWLKESEVIRKKRMIPPHNDIEKVTNTFALVEFEDGSVEKVRVEDIRFLDSRSRFESYSFEEER